MTARPAHDDEHVHDEACAAAHGDVRLPPPEARLVVVFSSPVADELTVLAARLDWRVTLLEPQADRAPADPDRDVRVTVVEAQLDASCDVVVCDHDRAELGDLLAEILGTSARWVGVMGSPRHTAPHIGALRARGLPESEIDRVHRPIGLDIGSHTPPEIALATLAGLVADRNGRSGGQRSA